MIYILILLAIACAGYFVWCFVDFILLAMDYWEHRNE